MTGPIVAADGWGLVAVVLLDGTRSPERTVGPFPFLVDAQSWTRSRGLATARYTVVPHELPGWPEPDRAR